MAKVALKSVEFIDSTIRGPGPRNQSEVTGTFTTHKTKHGELEPSPTGLKLTWDQEAHAIIIEKPDTTVDPVVVVGWHMVRRVLPIGPETTQPRKNEPKQAQAL